MSPRVAVVLAGIALLIAPGSLLADERDAMKAAIEKGLRRVEAGAANYTTHRACFSCHHQAMPLLAMTEGRHRGIEVEAKKPAQQVDFILKDYKPREGAVAKGTGVGGATTTLGYALWSLAAAEHKPDSTTTAMVKYILGKQRPDGSWPAQAKRPPSEGSPFTSTGVALIGLTAYGLRATGDADEVKELTANVRAAIEKARRWLLEGSPADTEERVFHLIGLLIVEAPAAEIQKARDRLLKEQRADGGWAQLPDMESDAYATGSALIALERAGLAATSQPYRKGVRFLLKTQREDGAWVVETRSRPIQTFFDNGDAGGKSQFISMAATSWATWALLKAWK
jgi:N-acyl-D-amino-acid deacylase